jgi:16S rRNA (cytosine967-C5)-methyltransferase
MCPETDSPNEQPQRADAWANARVPEGNKQASVPRLDSGRLLAFHVLQQASRSDRYLQDLFSENDSRHRLTPQQRALAVDIASGVVRRRATIDAILRSQIKREQDSIETDLWLVLQIGVCQLLFARTPGHAAVNETVELCRRLNRERWTRFVNGVLRGVGRLLRDKETAEAAADAVPLATGQYRCLAAPVLPDPAGDPEKYLSEAFSLPPELISSWRGRLSQAQLHAACFHSIRPPETCLRVNSLRANTMDLIQQLRDSGCEVRAGQTEGSLWVSHSGRIAQLTGFQEGLWSVQDESSMAAALLLNPKAGEQILDLCAAPGGKTTHLAELSGDRARITACDVTAGRLERVRQNAERLGLHSISTRLVARDGSDVPPGPFDAILIDAPCSNTGVLNRRPEARWRFCAASQLELVEIQLKLIKNASSLLRPGGRVVYSTCSMETQENEQVVRQFLQSDSQFELEREQFHVSGLPADGGYQALIVSRNA